MKWRDASIFGLGAAAGAAAAVAINEATKDNVAMRANETKTDDDQPIIMSGGSPLELHASGRHFVRGNSGDELVHATQSGKPTSGRVVTVVDEISPPQVGDPNIVDGKLEVKIQFRVGDGKDDVLTLISGKGKGLRVKGRNVADYLDPADPAHIFIPEVAIKAVTVNGKTCETSRFRMKIHYRGKD